MITPNNEIDHLVSRREIAKKLAYVAPTVLAVIAATARPALAQSHGGPSTPPRPGSPTIPPIPGHK
jgi:hypothetical protein